jgi:DNA ligase-1
MPDLRDGEIFEMKGSAAEPYELRNNGGVYSCSCPAWRNQGVPAEQRTCKHLRKLRGDEAEEARVLAAGGTLTTVRPRRSKPAPTLAEGTAPQPAEEDDAGAPVLLAERWDGVEDPVGWWMSEKLDGVRAYWDGNALTSRLGNPFQVPEWFLAGLPSTPLDGELWADRRVMRCAQQGSGAGFRLCRTEASGAPVRNLPRPVPTSASTQLAAVRPAGEPLRGGQGPVGRALRQPLRILARRL